MVEESVKREIIRVLEEIARDLGTDALDMFVSWVVEEKEPTYGKDAYDAIKSLIEEFGYDLISELVEVVKERYRPAPKIIEEAVFPPEEERIIGLPKIEKLTEFEISRLKVPPDVNIENIFRIRSLPLRERTIRIPETVDILYDVVEDKFYTIEDEKIVRISLREAVKLIKEGVIDLAELMEAELMLAFEKTIPDYLRVEPEKATKWYRKILEEQGPIIPGIPLFFAKRLELEFERLFKRRRKK